MLGWDVLCLRQAGGRRDDLRVEEWRVDVPTIGRVYLTASRVVCYFSGLGRPLSIKPGDFDSDRNWFRRAWTLQEICEDPIIAGDTADDRTTEVEMQTKFREQLLSLQDIKQGLSHTPVFAVLSHMQNRYSTNLWIKSRAWDICFGLGRYQHTMRHSPKRMLGWRWWLLCHH